MNRSLGFAALALLIGSAPLLRAQTAIAPEHDLKAAYLYHFIQFTEWPDQALPTLEPVHVCIDAADPLASALRALDRKTSGGRSIRVDTDQTDTASTPCQVWVVDRSHRPPAELAARPILTISADAGVAPQDVVISLYLRRGRVTFTVNKTLAQRQGLTISSKLLRLAESVQ